MTLITTNTAVGWTTLSVYEELAEYNNAEQDNEDATDDDE